MEFQICHRIMKKSKIKDAEHLLLTGKLEDGFARMIESLEKRYSLSPLAAEKYLIHKNRASYDKGGN